MATIGLVKSASPRNTRRRGQPAAESYGNTARKSFKPAVTSFGARLGVCEYRTNGILCSELELQGESLPGAATIYGVNAAAEKLQCRDSEPDLRIALRRLKEAHGPTHASMGEAYLKYGDLVRGGGMSAESRVAYQQALEIFVNEHGDVHRSVALSRAKLGVTLLYDSDFEAATQQLLDSQMVLTKLQAERSNDFAENLNTLGTIRLCMGATQLAVDNFRSALTIWQNNHAPVNPDIALAMSNLGTSYAVHGALDMAESYYRGALDMRRILYGNSKHIALAVVLNNLGMLLRRRGDLAMAVPLMRESLQLRNRICGPVSPAAAIALHNLAAVLRDNGNLLGAEEAQRDCVVAYTVLYGEDHPDVAITRASLAETLVAQGRHEEALGAVSAALIVLTSALGAAHWRVAAVNGIKGIALARLGSFASAEPLIVDAYESVRAARGDHDVFTCRALARVVQFYTESGQTGCLQEYKARQQDLYPES